MVMDADREDRGLRRLAVLIARRIERELEGREAVEAATAFANRRRRGSGGQAP